MILSDAKSVIFINTLVTSGLEHALCKIVVPKENNHLGMVGPERLRHISTDDLHVWIVFPLLLGSLSVY